MSYQSMLVGPIFRQLVCSAFLSVSRWKACRKHSTLISSCFTRKGVVQRSRLFHATDNFSVKAYMPHLKSALLWNQYCFIDQHLLAVNFYNLEMASADESVNQPFHGWRLNAFNKHYEDMSMLWGSFVTI